MCFGIQRYFRYFRKAILHPTRPAFINHNYGSIKMKSLYYLLSESFKEKKSQSKSLFPSGVF